MLLRNQPLAVDLSQSVCYPQGDAELRAVFGGDGDWLDHAGVSHLAIRNDVQVLNFVPIDRTGKRGKEALIVYLRTGTSEISVCNDSDAKAFVTASTAGLWFGQPGT